MTLVLEADGTEVEDDEYLETLQPHVSLVILKNGERWEGGKQTNYLEFFYTM